MRKKMKKNNNNNNKKGENQYGNIQQITRFNNNL